MWDERLNNYLDGKENIEEASSEMKKQFAAYKRTIKIITLRLSYHPSQRAKERFLRSIRREKAKKRGFAYAALVALAAFIILALGVFTNPPLVPSKNTASISSNKQIASQEGELQNLKKIEQGNLLMMKPSDFERTANNLKILEIAVDGF